MILCIDIGNSHIYGGVFQEENVLLRFRYSSTCPCTSDQFGVFLRAVLRENSLAIDAITHVIIASVVPSLEYSVHAAIIKYLKLEPFFLKAGVKTGLKIACKNPLEVGADRIANAIAAIAQFPNQDIIIVDLGTATTFDVVSREKVYLGGLIFPGINLAVKALNENTAKLPRVEIMKPNDIVGKTTIENIQAGIYYSNLAAISYITQKIARETFNATKNVVVIGTGGFASLFESENVFNVLLPDLILNGLLLALKKNLL